MATSRSLPSSSQRSGTQLPFSPVPPSNPASRLPRPHSGSEPSAPPSRPLSTSSSHLRPAQNMSHVGESVVLQTISLPLHQPRPVHNSTHATGILPPASFFHPSRPSYPPPSPSSPHGRRSSAGSTISLEAPALDALRLTTLSERRSHALSNLQSRCRR